MKIVSIASALVLSLSFGSAARAQSSANVCAAASLNLDQLRAKSDRELVRILCALGVLAAAAEKMKDRTAEELCGVAIRGLVREYKGRYPGRNFAATPTTCEPL